MKTTRRDFGFSLVGLVSALFLPEVGGAQAVRQEESFSDTDSFSDVVAEGVVIRSNSIQEYVRDDGSETWRLFLVLKGRGGNLPVIFWHELATEVARRGLSTPGTNLRVTGILVAYDHTYHMHARTINKLED